MTAVPAKFAVAAAVVALAAAQRTAVTIPPNAQLTRLLSVPSPDDESSRMLRVGDEEDDICHPITRWEHLPPLPEPKRCEMRMEASGGTVLVLALVAVFTGMTQGVALVPGKLTGAWWWLFFCLIYGEAACAIGCLLCLFGCVQCADDFEPIRSAQVPRVTMPGVAHSKCVLTRSNPRLSTEKV